MIIKDIMENQDKKQNAKAEHDPQSLVETIIPSTETEESKTTEVKHKITLETPESKVENEKVDKEDEEVIESEADEKDSEEKDTEQENSDEPTQDKKDGDDEADKIETVAP